MILRIMRESIEVIKLVLITVRILLIIWILKTITESERVNKKKSQKKSQSKKCTPVRNHKVFLNMIIPKIAEVEAEVNHKTIKKFEKMKKEGKNPPSKKFMNLAS